MSERLRPRDLAILAAESPSTPAHNATVEIFEPGPDGIDHARLVELVLDRISFVPRYRQRIQSVPGRLANPVWVDDDAFDIDYHVRRSALPRPGTDEQLRELVARIVSRPLDRGHPLWEVYVVEGLADGHVALLSKSHQVLVDGIDTVDLGQVLLDASPTPKALGGDAWLPHRRPSQTSLVLDAVRDSVSGPATALDTARSTAGSLLRGAGASAGRAGAVVGALAGRRPSGRVAFDGRLS